MNLDSSSVFSVPLGATTHHLAMQFRNQHGDAKIARQVFLNSLAVSAVEFYLQCMGIQTDRDTSYSCDPLMQAMMDVADLNLPEMGRLECRPVLSTDSVVRIPPESWADRIGYVAVRLEPSFRMATVLGFTPSAGNGEALVEQLQSLDNLMKHLQQLKSVDRWVTLSHWFQGLFANGWRSLDDWTGLAQPLALSFRTDTLADEKTIRRAKLLDLAVKLGQQSVVLLVAVTPEMEQRMGVSVQLHPVAGEPYLPIDIKLRLLAKTGEVLQEVRSRHQDNFIQLKRFRGAVGECFDIQVASAQEASLVESFII